MALNFDKTRSYSTGMTVASLGITQSATVGFWVRRDSTDTRAVFGSNPIRDTPAQGDTDVFTFFYVGSPWVRINTANTANATVNSGTWGTAWTHILATYNGANLRLYVNGSYVAQSAATGNLSTGGTRTFWIGSRGSFWQSAQNPGDTWAWFGDVAELVMYSAVLTDPEIVSLAKGFSASRVRPQSLLTYSRLVRTLSDAKGTSTASGTVVAASHPVAYG